MKFALRIFHFFASLELAVTLILIVAVVLSIGTIYESKYNAAIAGQLVYRAWWMQILLWLFMLNVSAAAISRLPWKKHHVGFLITHLGIIILLLGSWFTQKRGVDGILALAPGESGRLVKIDENLLYVFRTVPGKAYDLVLSEPLNFDLRKPSAKPLTFKLTEPNGKKIPLTVLRYFPKATRAVAAEDVAAGKGVPAVRFRLSGSRATFDDWIFLQADTGSTRDIGPARIRFIQGKPDLKQKPEKATLVLYLDGKPGQPPRLAAARKGEFFQDLGHAQLGKNVALGWMDFSFQLESFRTSAIPRAEYAPILNASPNAEGYQVIEAELDNEKIWLELGASGQIAVGDALYYLQFSKRQVDLGFDLLLNKFAIDYYEGTTRPKEYSSAVSVAGQNHLISMNEPLKHGGFTFYQASYEADDDGTPRVSVLSVNYDPGRPVKYAGSLMMVLGIISMFYFKPKYSGSNKWLKKGDS